MLDRYKIFCLFVLMSFPFTLLSETDGEYSEVADEDSNDVLLYIGLGSAADEELVDEDSWSVGLLLRDEKNFYGISLYKEAGCSNARLTE